MRWVLALVVVLAAGCGAAVPERAETPALTIGGSPVVDPQGLQMEAEAELSYTLSFGYVARAGQEAVSCWFARAGEAAEVDTRLWCGPVQVPGTAATTDWVPVPLKEVERGDGGIRLEVQPPQVPAPGNRSTPLGKLVRTDGREAEADQGVGEAGPDFLAVLPDDGRPLAEASGLLRDDQLATGVTGYATPESWRTDEGELRAEHGVRLRVLRLSVDRLTKTDTAFGRATWQGWAPQPPELFLQLPGRRHRLAVDRLPETGSVFVVYTVPEEGGPEELVLETVGAQSLEQRLEIPGGKPVGEGPAVLRRAAGPASPTPASLPVKVGDQAGALEVPRVRLGRQRPVSVEDRYVLATASAPDKALLELRLQGQGLPQAAGATITKDLVVVTLPDGTRAPQVGARLGGDTFPVAVVVEVPADVRSVTVAVTSGPVRLPVSGETTLDAPTPATIPLDF
ncbi:hypothetical protein ABZ816_41090 [Actinosynnema sp. NPDC047251]|uniref:Putative secreted protein n=1 Tax=Saccharothrix espanaensis (strain ATCC 51144 / DSM 44229 / JCM 9112 / NBRC 15066 / NRRL 15764) TaxID=1179773 RepID=K0JTR0_SACES|nr:hypothetical protein [Saccharothrix espanaensis]CCH28204.1 putative secreted protein [Saccharothrix espanaensis DSM 44229]